MFGIVTEHFAFITIAAPTIAQRSYRITVWIEWIVFYKVCCKSIRWTPPFFSTVLSFFSALNTNWLYISAINIDLQIRMLCAKLNRPNGFREEMWKVYKGMDRLTDGQTDKHTDDGQNEIRETLFSFQLRWSNLLIKLEFTFKLKTV